MQRSAAEQFKLKSALKKYLRKKAKSFSLRISAWRILEGVGGRRGTHFLELEKAHGKSLCEKSHGKIPCEGAH